MSEIDSKYESLGGSTGFLGSPTGPETMASDGLGRYRHYQYGTIFWHPSTGAHEIHGGIRQKWADLGWERSFLRYPVTDECATPAPNPNGRYNHFQGGSIYWHPNIGAHEIHGGIRQKWADLGWERSFLGFPTTDECATPAPNPSGRYNHFKGGSIYWHPDIGAFEVHGAIRDLWAANGWERVRYGFPITNETQMNPQDNGRFSRFQNGTIGWTPETSTWADFYGGDPEGRFESNLTLYKHNNFSGTSHVYPITTERPIIFYQTLVADGLNDQVSSVRVNGLPTHCSVYLYEHKYKGRWTRINGGPGTIQIAGLGSHLNDCVSSGYTVNHGLTSVIVTQAMMQGAAASAMTSFGVSGVDWDGPPSIAVLPERRLVVHLDGTITETWPDSYLHLNVYFRLFVSGPTTITARADGWHADYGGSFAGYANNEIGKRLHGFLDNTTNQATMVNALNQAFASQLSGLASGAALGISLRRLNFLPEGLEIVIADNDVGALVSAMGVPGVSSERTPGQITSGSI